MDLQALGNIGEFVGAIGVIATLLYLARQIREARTVAQAQNLREVVDGFRQLTFLTVSDAELARIVRVGYHNVEALTRIEMGRFSGYIGQLVLHFLECKTAHDENLMDPEVYERWRTYTAMVLNLPGTAVVWETLQRLFRDDVVAALNEARSRAPDVAELIPEVWGPLNELPDPAPE